jgi:hypothetical protein
LLPIALVVEVPAEPPEVGADAVGVCEQRPRRLGSLQIRPAGAEDVGLLEPDVLALAPR